MKVYIVGINWPPETFIDRKIRGLAAKGVQVTVCTNSLPNKADSNPKNIQVLSLALRNPLDIVGRIFLLLYGLIKNPLRILQYWQAISETQTSILASLKRFFEMLPLIDHTPSIIHFEWNSAAISYSYLFKWFDVPVVISCRGSQVQVAPHNPLRRTIIEGLRSTFQSATAVHCVSEAVKQEAMHYGLDPQKACIIHPSVSPDFFYPITVKNINTDIFKIITIGSLNWKKGYEYAITAIRYLSDRGIKSRFEIIGTGNLSEFQRILYTISDLGLESCIHLAGELTPEDIRTRLQQSDVFLLSSLSEGISNAVLEAMACGLPIVTTDCGGMREVIDNGIEGYVVPVRNPIALADALSILANDYPLRLRMGAAGRNRILTQFGLDQQITQFLRLYASLLGSIDIST